MTKLTKFSEKRTFLPPDTHICMCVLGEGKKFSFYGKFVLVKPVLRFALLPCCPRFLLQVYDRTYKLAKVKAYTSTDNMRNFSLQYKMTIQNTRTKCIQNNPKCFEVKSHHGEK